MAKHPRIEIVLDEPPSVNRIWRQGRGRTYKDAKASAYCLKVSRLWRTQLGKTDVLFPAGVAVRYTFKWYRSRKAGDLSNRVKVVEDALNGIVWDDDKQVVECHLYRYDAPKGKGRVELLIEAAE